MKQSATTYDIIVIGGGASGMMAAGRAAELGAKVLLLEKNAHLGEKLKITGGGRCNITNAQDDEHLLLRHYGHAERHLYAAFAQYSMRDTFTFFESRGLPLVVQANLRAFPKSERAVDVCEVMEQYLAKGKVEIRRGAKVTQILSDNGMISGVEVKGEILTANSYIVATGGVSHPETGSTGDGFKWLQNLGHTVHEPLPSIVPLAASNKWIKQLAGVTLSDIKISFYLDDKRQFALKGNILCTHFGLSGPLILNSATRVADLLQAGTVTAQIDLFPTLDLGAMDDHIIEFFDQQKNKVFKNVIRGLVPAGSSAVLLPLTKINPETKVHSVTKVERKALAQLLKALPVTITGLMGHDRAVITDGGVDLKEVDTKFMRSRLFSNLYLTGDMLHISRPSGGYSLQLCWTTGFVAGTHAVPGR